MIKGILVLYFSVFHFLAFIPGKLLKLTEPYLQSVRLRYYFPPHTVVVRLTSDSRYKGLSAMSALEFLNYVLLTIVHGEGIAL